MHRCRLTCGPAYTHCPPYTYPLASTDILLLVRTHCSLSSTCLVCQATWRQAFCSVLCRGSMSIFLLQFCWHLIKELQMMLFGTLYSVVSVMRRYRMHACRHTPVQAPMQCLLACCVLHHHLALPYREEVFGPVFTILKFRTDADAVALANDCAFGLGSTVFSRSKSRANKIAYQLQVGCFCTPCDTVDPC